jgi:hypothetical protein
VYIMSSTAAFNLGMPSDLFSHTRFHKISTAKPDTRFVPQDQSSRKAGGGLADEALSSRRVVTQAGLARTLTCAFLKPAFAHENIKVGAKGLCPHTVQGAPHTICPC